MVGVRVALLLILLLAASHAAPAAAAPLFQEASPVPTPTPGPGADSDLSGALQGFGNQLLSQLGGIIQQALSDWFTNAGPGYFGKLLASAFGVLADFLWNIAGGLLGGVNIFTQLPPAWTYDLAP